MNTRLKYLTLGTERERLDTDTRIFRGHEYTRSLSQTITQTLTPKHTRRMCVCVFARARVCLCCCSKGEQPPSASVYGQGTLTRHPRADSGSIKASGCAALCGLTSDCKAAPRASARAHPAKVSTCGLHMMRRESACKSAAEHVKQKTPELLRYSIPGKPHLKP
jgi:hypothetical protein